MAASKNRITQAVRYWYGSRLAVIMESIIIGAVAGLVVVLFRYLLVQGENLRTFIYRTLPELPLWWTLFWILALVLIGLFLGWAAQKRPMIRGSLSAFVTADLIASRPIYAVLLERMSKPKLRDQESLAGNDDG